MKDTIVALATPIGRSGIGVIRLSGVNALEIVRRLCAEADFDFKPRFAHFKKIYDIRTGDVLDEVVITYFKSPQSFTGEDVIEISGHGSPVVLRQIIDSCLQMNARMADPGEFSLRALSNGKMNLAQAEAVRDLIDAQTAAAARQSVRQLRGELSGQLQPLKDNLLDVIIVLESAMEFVEDDLPDFQIAGINTNLQSIAGSVNAVAATFQAGRLIREGIKIALVGRPNVGKSSLFNKLIGHDRAIVTDIAGTTRDQLHEQITVNNIPISLLDTAGLRETSDTVESIGVERSKRAMNDADLVVVLLDGSEPFQPEDESIIKETAVLDRLIVLNKSDLPVAASTREYLKKLDARPIKVSAKTGAGLDELRRAVIEPFNSQQVESGSFLVSDARHYDLLIRAGKEINQSISLLENRTSEEIVLIGLHNALRYLGQITGETTTEDMLTRIFSTFCIGK